MLHGTRTSHGGYVFDYDPEVQAVAPKHTAGRPRIGDERSRALIGTNIETRQETTYDYVGAVKYAGFATSAVYLCLAGGMQTHKGHAWRYADGQPHRAPTETAHLKGARTKHGGSRPVVGTHKITGEIVRFDYIKQAAEALGIFPQNISGAIRAKAQGKPHATAGYYWAFADSDRP